MGRHGVTALPRWVAWRCAGVVACSAHQHQCGLAQLSNHPSLAPPLAAGWTNFKVRIFNFCEAYRRTCAVLAACSLHAGGCGLWRLNSLLPPGTCRRFSATERGRSKPSLCRAGGTARSMAAGTGHAVLRHQPSQPARMGHSPTPTAPPQLNLSGGTDFPSIAAGRTSCCFDSAPFGCPAIFACTPCFAHQPAALPMPVLVHQDPPAAACDCYMGRCAM